MQNFDEMFLLLWCQIVHSLLSLHKESGIGMKLANVVEQRWGDVAGMPVRLQGMHRILFYGSID